MSLPEGLLSLFSRAQSDAPLCIAPRYFAVFYKFKSTHLGRLKERYHQASRYVKVNFEDLRLSWRWNRDELHLVASRDGPYLLRTNLESSDPAKLWSQYIQQG
jgi:hypothetical protein